MSFTSQVKAKTQTPTLREKFINEDGAIDLASIMVGIIVIGIIGGIIAATIFAVIPWSQDNGAKESLSAIKTTEGVQRVKENQYMTKDELITNGQITKSNQKYQVVTNSNGTCYLAVTLSESGKAFWLSDTNQKAKAWDGVATDACGNIGSIIADLQNSSQNGGGNNSSAEQAYFARKAISQVVNPATGAGFAATLPSSGQPVYNGLTPLMEHVDGSALDPSISSKISASARFVESNDPGELYIGNTKVGTFSSGAFIQYATETNPVLASDVVNVGDVKLTPGLPLSTFSNLFKGQGKIVFHDSSWNIPASAAAAAQTNADGYSSGSHTVTLNIVHPIQTDSGTVMLRAYTDLAQVKGTSLEYYLRQMDPTLQNTPFAYGSMDVYYSPSGNDSDYAKVADTETNGPQYSPGQPEESSIQLAKDFVPSIPIPANGGKLKIVVSYPNGDVYTFVGVPDDSK